MAYSSHCFFFVSVALLLQFLIAPASALPLQSTQYIDDLCKMPSIDDKTFCLQTLTGYQGAMYAGSSITLAQIVISGLLVPHVQKTMRFALLTSAKEPPKYLRTVGYSLAKAFDQLAVSPRSSTQDVMSCTDQITKVLNLIGKNQDVASKTLIEMTMRMKKLLPLGVAAAQAVAG
ncbi:uncharacterized protein LOC17876562 isoform X2 [Capsella rubella]|uniref:uncharacterized protein LOC17876562 isoform X2 n=1 Tax=Capsella rubella TaxID=81985 RepID=UPI000CD59C2A|nr:uncharacterized protein LOC17876562 isoform X2 [Capsella rubella]